MPSKTFQPLLFDSFKYTYPNTTYEDHYKFYKHKFLSKALLNKSLSQKEKMALLTKRSRPFTAFNSSKDIDLYKNYNSNSSNKPRLAKSNSFSIIRKNENHVRVDLNQNKPYSNNILLFTLELFNTNLFIYYF
jgi:hypothetical protein